MRFPVILLCALVVSNALAAPPAKPPAQAAYAKRPEVKAFISETFASLETRSKRHPG